MSFMLMKHRYTVVAIIVATMLPSLIWVFSDNALWAWDEISYGRYAIELWVTLTEKPSEYLWYFFKSPRIRAPGNSWIGQFFVPLGHLFGSVDHALCLSIILTQGVVLFVIYYSCMAYYKGKWLESVCAMLFVGAAPLFVNVSHYFLTEPLQTLATALLLYVYVTSDRRHLVDQWVLSAMMLSIGLLAKAPTPLYMCVPLLMLAQQTLYNLRHKVRTEVKINPYVVVGALSVCAVSVLWYSLHIQGIWNFVLSTSHGEIAHHYGQVRPYPEKIMWWLSAVLDTVSSGVFRWIYAPVLCASTLLALIQYKGKPQSAVLAVQCIVLIGVFSMNVEEMHRVLMAMMPYGAFMVCGLLCTIRRSTVTALLLCVVLGQAVVSNRDALKSGVSTYQWSGLPITRPERSGERKEAMRELIVDTSQMDELENSILSLTFRSVDVNADSLRYHSAQYAYLNAGSSRYYGYVPMSGEGNEGLAKISQENPLYIITSSDDYMQRYEPVLRWYIEGILDQITKNGQYTRSKEYSAISVVLYKRNSP